MMIGNGHATTQIEQIESPPEKRAIHIPSVMRSKESCRRSTFSNMSAPTSELGSDDAIIDRGCISLMVVLHTCIMIAAFIQHLYSYINVRGCSTGRTICPSGFTTNKPTVTSVSSGVSMLSMST